MQIEFQLFTVVEGYFNKISAYFHEGIPLLQLLVLQLNWKKHLIQAMTRSKKHLNSLVYDSKSFLKHTKANISNIQNIFI